MGQVVRGMDRRRESSWTASVQERHFPAAEELATWSAELREWWSLGPFPGHVPGLVRRVRRILDVSQRGLAALLGVSQSAVARWETARTSPRLSVLEELLRLAGLQVTLVDKASGETVEPMRDDGARTTAGSRFPAHVDLRASGWWIPQRLRSWTSVDALTWERSSRRSKTPAVTYRRCPDVRRLERQLYGTPIDHPALHQLIAQVELIDERREQRREGQRRRARRDPRAA